MLVLLTIQYSVIVLNHFRNGRASLSAYQLNDALGSMSFFLLSIHQTIHLVIKTTPIVNFATFIRREVTTLSKMCH